MLKSHSRPVLIFSVIHQSNVEREKVRIIRKVEIGYVRSIATDVQTKTRGNSHSWPWNNLGYVEIRAKTKETDAYEDKNKKERWKGRTILVKIESENIRMIELQYCFIYSINWQNHEPFLYGQTGRQRNHTSQTFARTTSLWDSNHLAPRISWTSYFHSLSAWNFSLSLRPQKWKQNPIYQNLLIFCRTEVVRRRYNFLPGNKTKFDLLSLPSSQK